MKRFIYIVVSILVLIACEEGGGDGAYDTNQGDADSDTVTDTDSDNDNDNDNDDDDDSDSDTDTNIPVGDERIAGIVKSASGFPISGALVHLKTENGPEIPDEAYCQDCDEVIYGWWALSNADGTWAIDTAPNGTFNIITRKGNFQRQRTITIEDSDSVQTVPEELTTLPGANTSDGMDQIPNFAVLMNFWDRPENMLAKMGLGDEDSSGGLVLGTENFPFLDGYIALDGYSSTSYEDHGLIYNEDGSWTIGGPVQPYVWVTDNQESPGKPLTLTYTYDCGKVFYSTYQVASLEPQPTIAPQEWVLIYLFYEIGVCEGESPEVPPPPV